MKTSTIIQVAILLFTFKPHSAQFPELSNAIFGPNSIVRGMKNVVGGVLGLDTVHSQCIQKTVCSEMGNQIIDVRADLDPVKRTWVYQPKVIKKRGRLRWIGDAIFDSVAKVARKIGLVPNSNRRQGDGGMVGNAIAFTTNAFKKIPTDSILHVMDFIVDTTHIMERKGAVYPFVRAATLGYGFSPKRREDFDICGQIAENCEGWWSHLKTVNDYDGGALSRKVAEERISRVSAKDGESVGSSSVDWNSMELKDIFEPRVFLCKAGRFLENINGQMGGEGVVKEKFGNEKFQESCRPSDFQIKPKVSSEDSLDSTDADNDAIVITGNVSDNNGKDVDTEIDSDADETSDNELETIETESDSEAIHDLPVLVFEGLPEPRVAQSEEDLIESILSKTAQIPSTAVRKAVRLPIKNNGRTLVMVEMDTIENEMKVLKKETTEALTKDAHLDHVGIRTAKYKELWKMVEQLSVAKQFIGDPPEYDDSGSMTMTNDDENDAMIIEEKDSSLL